MRKRLAHCLTAIVILAALVLPGCGFLGRYYGIQPTMTQSFLVPGTKCPEDTRPKPGDQLPPVLDATDVAVLCYMNSMVVMLRSRFNVARIARTLSGTAAVLTAASAAALTAASGPGTAVLALAATSAVLPEVASIVDARERSKAYEEGLKLIGDAYHRYLMAVAEKFGGLIPQQTLTVEGAQLFGAVVSSLHVVESLLAAQLPTIEALQQARGHYSPVMLAFTTTDVFADKPLEIVVSGGFAPHKVDPAPGFEASTTSADGKTTVKLFARGATPGPHSIVFKDSQNSSKTLTVTVVAATPLTATALVPTLGTNSLAVIAVSGGTKPYTVKGVVPSTAPVNLTPQAGQKLDKDAPFVTVQLRPDATPSAHAADRYRITVTDDAKGEATAEVATVLALAVLQQGTAKPARGGELVYTVVGGAPPYRVVGVLPGSAGPLTVKPDPNDNLPTGNPNIVVTIPANAPAGGYQVGVRDNAAPVAATATITIDLPTAARCPEPGGTELVCRVQRALKSAGFDPQGIDGLEGKKTIAALNAYQSKNGLTASKTVDDAPTLAKLGVTR